MGSSPTLDGLVSYYAARSDRMVAAMKKCREHAAYLVEHHKAVEAELIVEIIDEALSDTKCQSVGGDDD